MNDRFELFFFEYLTNHVGEKHVAQQILMFAAPMMEEELKMDISTFYFTWNAVVNCHVEMKVEEVQNMEGFYDDSGGDETNTKWFVYNDLLRDIDSLIIEHKIERRHGYSFAGIDRMYWNYSNNDSCDRFRVYWQNYILSSWNPDQSFLVLAGSLNQRELMDLCKKFILRFSPFARFLLLRKLGVLYGIGGLSV